MFAFSDGSEFDHVLQLVERVRNSLGALNIMDACAEADTDGNGFLSHSEIMQVFQHVGVHNVSPADLSHLVSMMDSDGDNAIEYYEFTKLFSPRANSNERADTLRTVTGISGGGSGGSGSGGSGGRGGSGGNGGGKKQQEEEDHRAEEERERALQERIKKKKDEIRRRKLQREEAEKKRREEEEEEEEENPTQQH